MKFDFTKYVSTGDFLVTFSNCVFCQDKCIFKKETFTFLCSKCLWEVTIVWPNSDFYDIPVPKRLEAVITINSKLVISIERDLVILNQLLPPYDVNAINHGITAGINKKTLLKARPVDFDEIKLIVDKYKVLT